MSKKEIDKIKTIIYEKVNELNDETLLQMVNEAITAYGSSSRQEILDELTPEQHQRLQESIKQADEGNTVSNEEVKKKTKEWLSK